MKKIIIILAFISFVQISAQVNFTSSRLPIVKINTNGQQIVDEPKITAELQIIFNGEGKTNYVNDVPNDYNGQIGIEIRGSSSQSFPKKSYAFETRTVNNEDTSVSILGFPEEEDWILYAPYSDKSLIRNVLACELANKIGRYASRTKFVEVMLNGNYIGIYVLMEKIKRDKNRVDISKLTELDNSGIELSGGYIFKTDKWTGAFNDGWSSNFPADLNNQIYPPYLFHYPAPDKITTEQKEYIENFMDDLETVLHGNDFDDPFSGFSVEIDINSFADFILVNEFGRNVDSYRLSTFLVKDKEIDKLQAGPIWDFNLAFGNADYYNGHQTTGWQIDEDDLPAWDSYQPPFWWKKIFNNPIVKNRISRKWFKFRNSLYSDSWLIDFIYNTKTALGEAINRNFQRWPVLGQYVWPNYFVGDTYESEINYLTGWVLQRAAWMDNNLDSNYIEIDWKNRQSVNFSADPNSITSFPLSYFFENENQNEVEIFAEDQLLKVIIENDSAKFYSTQVGEYNFKLGIKKDGILNELSPLYTYYCGLTGMNEIEKLSSFSLSQNYPNPFNPATTIRYSIPVAALSAMPAGRQEVEAQHVTLKIYDILGNEIATLVNGKQSAGIYEVEFNASNISNGKHGLASGFYIYRLTAGSFTSAKKMIFLK